MQVNPKRVIKNGLLEIKEWQTSANGFNSTFVITCPKCKKKSSLTHWSKKVSCGHCGHIINLGY